MSLIQCLSPTWYIYFNKTLKHYIFIRIDPRLTKNVYGIIFLVQIHDLRPTLLQYFTYFTLSVMSKSNYYMYRSFAINNVFAWRSMLLYSISRLLSHLMTTSLVTNLNWVQAHYAPPAVPHVTTLQRRFLSTAHVTRQSIPDASLKQRQTDAALPPATHLQSTCAPQMGVWNELRSPMLQ